MARGGSVASQTVPKRWTRTWTTTLFPLVVAALVFAVLRLCGPAVTTLVAAVVDRRLDHPWIRLALCGAAGLVLFFLLWTVLRLAGVLRNPASTVQPGSGPSATVAQCIEDPQPRVDAVPAPPGPEIVARTVAACPPPSPSTDLQNASRRDSRLRTRAHFSGQKRRADYSGPRRRATDPRSDPNYVGPLQQAYGPQNPGSSPSGESVNRSTADRRIAGHSRPPQEEEARLPKIAPTEAGLLAKAPAHVMNHLATGPVIMPGSIACDASELAEQTFHRS